MTLGYGLCAAITLISSLVSLGFSIAALRSATLESKTNAMYLTARSAALAVVAIVPLFHHADAWLTAAAVAMTLLQALDAVIGQRLHDRRATFGPAGMALLNLLALLYFLA